jgi:hypothetical protein
MKTYLVAEVNQLVSVKYVLQQGSSKGGCSGCMCTPSQKKTKKQKTLRILDINVNITILLSL